MSNFLVLLKDYKYGDSEEEKYTVEQVRRLLINTLEELKVVDIIETKQETI